MSKPDICACLANIASRANALQGGDIYRINDLIKTIKLWQPRTVLKYESSSNPLFPPTGDSLGRFRARGERLHKGTLTLAGWSDAAYGGLSEEGRCRLGYIIGLMSSSLSLSGPCHVLQWTSKFTRKFVTGSLVGRGLCIQ